MAKKDTTVYLKIVRFSDFFYRNEGFFLIRERETVLRSELVRKDCGGKKEKGPQQFTAETLPSSWSIRQRN
jgi:hypothetical protein